MRLSISMVKPEDKDSAAPNPGGPNPGDPREMDAFPEFFALHYGYLLKCCVKILGNMEDSEEIVQETFIRYLRKGHRFRGDSSVRTYLYRIAVNLCMNEIRRYRKRKSTPLHLCRDAADSPMPERELMWTVQRALGTLEPSFLEGAPGSAGDGGDGMGGDQRYTENQRIRGAKPGVQGEEAAQGKAGTGRGGMISGSDSRGD